MRAHGKNNACRLVLALSAAVSLLGNSSVYSAQVQWAEEVRSA